MKPIAIDDVFRFKYLSEISFSPEGKSACLAVTAADRKKDGYKSCLYVYKDGKFTKLTSGGKERSFIYLDEDTLLFPGDREEKDEGAKAPELTSRWYKIRLDGGEAELAYEFPVPVSKLIPLENGDMILVGRTLPGFEELYKADKKYTAAWKKHAKENADYEIIEQVPWWWNGGPHTKGAYSSLFYYDHVKKSMKMLSELNENVHDVKLGKDKKTLYYLSDPVRPLLPIMGETKLKKMDIASGETSVLTESAKNFEPFGYELGDSFILLVASDLHNGMNTDGDFYRLSYEGGKPELILKHGESIGTSVGADIRYGGGRSVKMDGDTLYFISTRFDGAYLFRLEEGNITRLTDRPGSVDCFDVCGDKFMMIALYGMRGQEVYDLKGRKLSSFNDRALSGKYVAQPEKLNVKRDGYEIHGFVLKPMDYDPEKKYPVIIDIHGGPKTVYGEVFYHEMQYWAGKGYFVIFCNPTGSDGRGDFMDIMGKYGTVDYEDIMAFCDAALEAYPAMDKDNFFETGGSYGGFMTNWIIGHTDRFRACASQRSISNWFSMYGVSDIGVSFTKDQCLSDPWNDPEKLWFHSPMKYADKAKTPTLFIHSFEDYRCPIDQGYQMFTSLIAHGVEAKMVTFRGENHELSRSGKPSHRLKRLKEITGWFDGHKKEKD